MILKMKIMNPIKKKTKENRMSKNDLNRTIENIRNNDEFDDYEKDKLIERAKRQEAHMGRMSRTLEDNLEEE